MKRCDWDSTPAAKKAPSSGKVFFDPLQRPILVLGGLGKNTDQIPRISGAHHFLSRIIGIKFPEFMPAAQRHLSKIWPFLPWRKLENQVEVFLLAF